MPNLTINVPDPLKAEMDNLSEVNWSEVCRNAISRYMAQRKNPTPKIELDLRSSRLTHLAFETGYPTLSMDLRIYNKMDSEITVDRILFNISFIKESTYHAIGSGYYLHKRNIGSNSFGVAQIHLVLPKEKIRELEDVFNSTFDCRVRCVVFVEGFRNEYNTEVQTRIPIDIWENLVKRVLKTPEESIEGRVGQGL